MPSLKDFDEYKRQLRWTEGIVTVEPFRLAPEVTDDGRLARAIEEALKFPSFAEIRVPANDALRLSKGFDVITNRYAIVGSASCLDFSGMPDLAGNVGVHFYSDAEYKNLYKNVQDSMVGCFVVGAWSQSALPKHKTGILIGHDTYHWNANFNLRKVGIQGFGTGGNLRFTHNAWRIGLEDINSRWGAFDVPAGLSNFGENMHISDSAFYDFPSDCAMCIGSGSFSFRNTSLDNCPLIVNGDARVFMDSWHNERPNSKVSSGNRIRIEHKDGAVSIKHADIVPPGSGVIDFKDPFFYVTPENTQNGLIIDTVKLFTVPNFKPYWNNGDQELVGGGGRNHIEKILTWDNGNNFVISKYSNRIANANAELGKTASWDASSGSGTFTVVPAPAFDVEPADATDPKYAKFLKGFGKYSFRLFADAGQAKEVFQNFSVEPGDRVMAQLWRKVEITGTGVFSRKIRFFSWNGTLLYETCYKEVLCTSDWHISYKDFWAIAPQGASYAQLILRAAATTGTTTAYVDDVILNVSH